MAPQARRQDAPSPSRPLAPHVQQMLAKTSAVQARPSLPPAGARRSAPRTVQRADNPTERLRARKEQFDAKLGALRHMPHQDEEMDPEGRRVGQISLDEIAASAFSSLGAHATGAVAYLGDRLLFAGQGGVAHRNWGTLSGEFAVLGTIEAADESVPHPNMHAEMIIIYYCLRNAIDLGTIQAIGVKDKGCCRACAAVLSHLGIAYTFTQSSIYELQWQDPWEHAGRASPIGKGSGLTTDERRLL